MPLFLPRPHKILYGINMLKHTVVKPTVSLLLFNFAVEEDQVGWNWILSLAIRENSSSKMKITNAMLKLRNPVPVDSTQATTESLFALKDLGKAFIP